MRISQFLIPFVFLFNLFAFSQVASETTPPLDIKTITFKGNTDVSMLPILNLGEPLTLEFDVLNGNEADFYYTIKHFNYDWTPSSLMRQEYIDGFDKQRIVNYENSYNTFQIFSHYMLTIPNDQVRQLKVSGNYMIFVYNEDDELMFSRKFMINEGGANVGVSIKRSRDVTFVNEKQTVDITINSNNIQFTNPKQTVKTSIIQNNNLKSSINNIEPMYTMGNTLTYKYTNETSFWAGNEYFYFENKDVRVANTGVNFVDLQDIYHSYLYTNEVRKHRPYTYNPDINGNFVINTINGTDPNIEADYTYVHFSLASNEFPLNKSVHVFGNFNNYEVNNETKMTYNQNKGIYEGTLLLKQGFYNYKFVTKDESNQVDEGEIGGNFYQTENDYKVIVYYRELGGRYDKIIGLGEASSVNISN
ncbi:DUF5103 domain-containing protein [Formosa sp. S-31]|uniref:type IX secretion system plug protein n=1 Tax=Formosa sp. S-31 TaxID=2790949 RepID=UPI003EB7F940